MRKRYPKKDLWKESPKPEEKKEEEKPHFVLEVQDAVMGLDSMFVTEPKKEKE